VRAISEVAAPHFQANESTATSVERPIDLNASFGRVAPVEVDLGSGHGSFLLAMAAQFPARNFLGVEHYGRRVRKTERAAAARGLANLRVWMVENEYAVQRLFAPVSVDVFHVAFPDPWPKRRHWPRRLVNDSFLDAVHRALHAGGELRVQTDHAGYGEWIDAIVARRADYARLDWPDDPDYPRTDFEQRFAGQQFYRARLRKV
jgi:tRNA (guanine-N7-)-methyltransferase